jgi:Mn2+/Fe2+ NRAMP family transporter
VLIGIIFSNLVLYTITLSTAATLFKAGQRDINTAADAAKALQPLAGEAAAALFVIGMTAVGFLAIPIMTTGAAYDLCQTFRWKDGLHRKPSEAKLFYTAIAIFTLIAMCINFIGINPMKALVTAGIVQGFSTPPLLLLIMLMTNNRAVMGQQINGPYINILGWLTTAAIFLASIGLVVTAFM